MTDKEEILSILYGEDNKAKRALFSFDSDDSDEIVLFKFKLWAGYYKPNYFKNEDAPFHHEMDKFNLKCYREPFTFVNIGYRGCAKTLRTKIFIAYAIANDLEHRRKYFKILSHELANACQITTDIYNIFVMPRFKLVYPELFAKTDTKAEERMNGFSIASFGVKILAGTVGKQQRGGLQDESRPDYIYFDDFEDKKTLRSAVITKAIGDTMEEARQSLPTDGSGSCVYCCNYISEAGNVHKLVNIGDNNQRKVMITPILDKEGKPTWSSVHTPEIIKAMQETDDDFTGEKMCNPRASKDIYFDRLSLDRQGSMLPIKEIAGFKIFSEYNPSHEYASGHDIAGGVGLDSSTSVFIDFKTYPAQVVATYKSDTIKPDVFGYEIKREVDMYGNCLAGIEKNNHGHATIAICKQIEVNMFETIQNATKKDDNQPTEYGWNTNALTKPKMMTELFDALFCGLLVLNDLDLINEVKGYTRNDLLEFVRDPSLTTRHFDLLIACAITWQMKDFRLASNHTLIRQQAVANKRRESYKPMTEYGG